MKIKIEIDTSPDELRRFFGLPDVEPLHAELLAQLQERMKAGVEGYDPFSLMKPFLPDTLKSLEGFQKAIWGTAGSDRKKDE